MAVLETHQKKESGQTLAKHCETYCNANKVDLIWFNARTTAVGFYKKIDYQPLSKLFDIKDVGEHYLMFKKLQNEQTLLFFSNMHFYWLQKGYS